MKKYKRCKNKYGGLEYYSEEINELIDRYDLKPAAMKGVHDDLEKLKPKIEEFFKDNIFYLDDWESEAPYHGWLWEEDNGKMKNMATITKGIEQRFIEIYALILGGLDLRFEDIDDEIFDLIKK